MWVRSDSWCSKTGVVKFLGDRMDCTGWYTPKKWGIRIGGRQIVTTASEVGEHPIDVFLHSENGGCMTLG